MQKQHPNSQTIHRTKISPLLLSTRGRFFHVIFTKKDKTTRSMLCRVPKPKPDPKRASNATSASPYLLVVDVKIYQTLRPALGPKAAQDKSYRLINLATIKEFTTNKVHYTVTD